MPRSRQGPADLGNGRSNFQCYLNIHIILYTLFKLTCRSVKLLYTPAKTLWIVLMRMSLSSKTKCSSVQRHLLKSGKFTTTAKSFVHVEQTANSWLHKLITKIKPSF